jgi:hypothetical protein
MNYLEAQEIIQSLNLQPGTYRLTKDLPAIKPDKRSTRDWRCQELKAGMMFCVEDNSWELHPELQTNGAKLLVVFHQNGYSFKNIRVQAGDQNKHVEFLQALERVEEKPSDWLTRTSNGVWASDVLDRLVETGRVTLSEIQETVEKLKNECG